MLTVTQVLFLKRKVYNIIQNLIQYNVADVYSK